jgi:hypothetical protein
MLHFASYKIKNVEETEEIIETVAATVTCAVTKSEL